MTLYIVVYNNFQILLARAQGLSILPIEIVVYLTHNSQRKFQPFILDSERKFSFLIFLVRISIGEGMGLSSLHKI